MIVHSLLVGAGIFAGLAAAGLTWIVLDAWAQGRIRKAYRDADVTYEDPEVPEWVNEGGPRVCPPRPRRKGDYRNRCSS
jgi:hypothetical protein